MKLVDCSVIPESVEFILNLLNVVVTKHFFFSLMKLSNLSQITCICIYMSMYICMRYQIFFLHKSFKVSYQAV